jgi:FlgD Ig-like domain
MELLMHRGGILAPLQLALAIALGFTLPTQPADAVVLSGRVVDPVGAPVPDVDLDVVDLATGITQVIMDDDTDSDGEYAIDIPAGTYRILFEPSPALRLAPHVEPRFEITEDTVFNLSLAQGWSLAGRVTDPNGIGLADVDLDVWDPAVGVTLPTPGDNTNQLGFYTIIVPEGVYEVRATAPFATRLVPVRLDSVSVDAEDVIVNLRLEPGLVLSGTVRNPAGAGIPGIDLDATDLMTGLDVFLGEDGTDAQGTFALVVHAGRYRIGIDAPARTRFVSRIEPEIEMVSDRTLDITLEPGHLVSGTVADPVGQPVEGANLDFIAASTGETVPTPSDFSNLQGEYAVVLPTGTYDVVARPPDGADYQADTTRAVSVVGDLHLDVRFGTVLTPGAVLALEPIFPNPTPATATLRFEIAAGVSGPVEITILDAQGRVVDVLHASVDSTRRGTVSWDGRSQRGFPAPSGIYFVRAQSGDHTAFQKLVIFRESLEP